MKSNRIVLCIIIGLSIPLIFYLIKILAEDYLATTIDQLIHSYKISTRVASTMLIPMANGAPDLMVAIVASKDNSGIHIALGSIMGAFIFASCLITSAVIWGT